MKKYVILTILIIGSINIFAQGEGKYTYLEVTKDLDVGEELNVRDTSLIDLIQEHSSSATNTASDGIEKVVNNFQLGGSFTQDVATDGAGYTYEIGKSTSKLGGFKIYSNDDIYYSADDKFIVQATGVTWTCSGDYWISDNSDTLMTNDLVDEKILASAQDLPFNLEFNYSTTLTDSRPGSSFFRLNNQVYSSATQIFIDYFDNGSTDKSDFLSLPDTGSLVTISDGINYINYKLNGGITPASSYYKYNVTYQNHSGVISGLCTINIDNSNSSGTGGGGGSTDSLYYAYTGIWLVGGDTIPDSTSFALNATKDSVAATYTATDTIITPLIYNPVDLAIKADDDLTMTVVDDAFFSLGNMIVSSDTDIEINSGGSTDIQVDSRIRLITLTTSMTFEDSTLNAENVYSEFKTTTAENVIGDTATIGGDTITGTTDPKTYIEGESFDNINTDTINGDSLIVTGKLSSEYYIGQVFTADGSVTISVAVADTYYTISGFETTGTGVISENLTITDSSITIPSDGHGYYDVYIGNSSTHSVNNSSVHASLFVNGVEYEPNEAERKIGTGGDFGDAGRSSIVLLNGGDVLTARIKSDNTGTITINHGTFYVARRN